MTLDMRLRRPVVAVRYLGVLVAAAVMALSAGVWHGGPFPVRATASAVDRAVIALSTGDAEHREPKPAILHQALRDRARALVTATAGPASAVPAWWVVIAGLAGGAVLVHRSRALRPRRVAVGPVPRGPPPRG